MRKCYQILDDYEIVGGSVEESEEVILAEDLALLGVHEGDAQLPILDYQKFFYPMEDTQAILFILSHLMMRESRSLSYQRDRTRGELVHHHLMTILILVLFAALRRK